MFITIYSCGSFFYGSKLASEDIAKQKEDAVVLKTSVTFGRSKDNFQSQRGRFLPLLSNLIGGKRRGVTFSISRTGRALFHGLFRLAVTPRSDRGTAKLGTFHIPSFALLAFFTVIEMSW